MSPENVALTSSSEREKYKVALACFLLAREIFDEVQSPNREVTQSYIEWLQGKIGKEQFDVLLAQVESQASQIVEQALQNEL